MFSDLVGSTALSVRMDPEDLREVISAYQKCVAETVQRFGGFVAKYMGDGVLVYFGYPQAHEGRRRAGSARRTEVGRCCSRSEDPRAPPDARRHQCDSWLENLLITYGVVFEGPFFHAKKESQ
jgi:class 3 adenylate cyclase